MKKLIVSSMYSFQMETSVAMPFLAMKMDSSLPNITKTTAWITKNGRFTQTIWTISRYNEVRKRVIDPFLVSLFSGIRDTNKVKLKHALDIPKLCSLFLQTRYLSSRFHRTDRQPWENTTWKQSLFFYHSRLNHPDRLCLAAVVEEVV